MSLFVHVTVKHTQRQNDAQSVKSCRPKAHGSRKAWYSHHLPCRCSNASSEQSLPKWRSRLMKRYTAQTHRASLMHLGFCHVVLSFLPRAPKVLPLGTRYSPLYKSSTSFTRAGERPGERPGEHVAHTDPWGVSREPRAIFAPSRCCRPRCPGHAGSPNPSDQAMRI